MNRKLLLLFFAVFVFNCADTVFLPEERIAEKKDTSIRDTVEEEDIVYYLYSKSDHDSVLFPLSCERIDGSDYYFTYWGVGIKAMQKVTEELGGGVPSPYYQGATEWEWGLMQNARHMWDVDDDSLYRYFKTGVLEPGVVYRIRVGYHGLNGWNLHPVPWNYFSKNKYAYADSADSMFAFKISYDGEIILVNDDCGVRPNELIVPRGDHGDTSETDWLVTWDVGDSLMTIYLNMDTLVNLAAPLDTVHFSEDDTLADGRILSGTVIFGGSPLWKIGFVEDDTLKPGLPMLNGYAGNTGIYQIPKPDSLELYFYGIYFLDRIDFSKSDYSEDGVLKLKF